MEKSSLKAWLDTWLASAGKFAETLLSRFDEKDVEGALAESDPESRQALLREVAVRVSMGDPLAAVGLIQSHLLRHPSDTHTLLQLGRLKVELGQIDSAIEILRRVIQNPYEGGTALRETAADDLSQLLLQECRNLRNTTQEKLAVGDFEGALPLSEKQLDLTGALLSVSDSTIPERILVPVVVTYNHAAATHAFSLWCSGRASLAEAVISAPPSRFDIPAGVLPTSLETERREMLAEMISNFGQQLFLRGKWLEAAHAFNFARTRGYEVVGEDSSRLANELLAREAMCQYNRRNYHRAYDLLSELIRRSPADEVRGIRILRRTAHQAKVLDECCKLYEKAAGAFEAEDWVTAIARYREVANFLEYREHADLRNLAAECYYNAAMAYCNSRRFDEGRRMLEYVRLAYPEHEPGKVAERLRQVENLARGFRHPLPGNGGERPASSDTNARAIR